MNIDSSFSAIHPTNHIRYCHFSILQGEVQVVNRYYALFHVCEGLLLPNALMLANARGFLPVAPGIEVIHLGKGEPLQDVEPSTNRRASLQQLVRHHPLL